MPVSGKKAIFAQLLARKDLYVGNVIRNYVGQNNIYYQNTRFMRSYHNIQLIELHSLYKIMTCHKKIFWCSNDSLLAIF